MEKMTQKERQTLKELSAKAKRIERAEKQFLSDADERKEELLARWNIKTDSGKELEEIAILYYGISAVELREWITSDRQVEYYKLRHQREVEEGTSSWG